MCRDVSPKWPRCRDEVDPTESGLWLSWLPREKPGSALRAHLICLIISIWHWSHPPLWLPFFTPLPGTHTPLFVFPAALTAFFLCLLCWCFISSLSQGLGVAQFSVLGSSHCVWAHSFGEHTPWHGFKEPIWKNSLIFLSSRGIYDSWD